MAGQAQFRNGLFCLRLYVKVNNISVILGRAVLSNQDEVLGKDRTRESDSFPTKLSVLPQ